MTQLTVVLSAFKNNVGRFNVFFFYFYYYYKFMGETHYFTF